MLSAKYFRGVLIVLMACAIAERGLADNSFMPSPAVQSSLHKLLKSSEDESFFQHIHTFGKTFGSDRERLVLELAYFASQATDVDQAMMPWFLAHQLGYDDADIVRFLAPHLSEESSPMQKTLRDWIIGADPSLRVERDGTRLRGLIQSYARRNTHVANALRSFVFEVAPTAALHDFISAYFPTDKDQARKLTWADHVVQDAIWRDEKRFRAEFEAILAKAEAELDWMSRHDASWVRLYVAVVLAKHPKLRNDEILARLLTDADEAVRDQAAAATDDKPHTNGAKK